MCTCRYKYICRLLYVLQSNVGTRNSKSVFRAIFTIAQVISTLNNIARGCISLASLALIITLASFTWGSQCKTQQTKLFSQVNVFLICYWAIAGAFFISFCFVAVIASCVPSQAPRNQGYDQLHQ
jgi:hypothetical protein